MNWNDDTQHWQRSEVTFKNHTHPKLPKRPEFAAGIIDSLIAAGHISEAGEIRNAGDIKDWKVIGLPKFSGRIRPQVAGLRVFRNAIKCTAENSNGKECRKSFLSEGSFAKHSRTVHEGGHTSEFRHFTAQSLTELTGWVIYITVSNEVPRDTFGPATTLDTSTLDSDGARALLRKTTTYFTNNLEIVPDLNAKALLPVFVETKIEYFLQPLDRDTLQRNYRISPRDSTYSTLRNVILKTFNEDIQSLSAPTFYTALLSAITNCTP